MEKTQLAPKSSECPKCKYLNPLGVQFCAECGCPLTPDALKQHKSESGKSEKAGVPEQSGTVVMGTKNIQPASSSGTVVMGSMVEKVDKKFKLVLLSEDKKPVENFKLKKKNTLGRTSGDILLQDPSASGKHCEMEIDGEEVILTDTNSKNGVFVRIEDSVRLKAGSELRIGYKLFRLEEE